VATTEGLVGGAVNIAARVCAKAQAGEVLVTDTVRALTRTYLPYRYTGLGTQHLKGISGGIPLYRVEAVPSTGRARLRRQLGARRGRVLAVAGLIVVLLAASAGLYAINRPVDCLTLPASTKDVVARIDPARNCVVATYAVGQRPGPVVASATAVWVGNLNDWTATRIDPVTRLAQTTGTAGAPTDLTLDPAGNLVLLILFSTSNAGSHTDLVGVIDGRTRRIVELRSLPSGTDPTGQTLPYQGITYAAGRAWVSNAASGAAIRMALGAAGPGSATIAVESKRKPTPVGPAGITGLGAIDQGGGSVWLANFLTPTLYRLQGDKPTAITLEGDAAATSIDATDREVWLVRTDGRLTRYDSLSGSQLSFPVEGSIRTIAVGADSVWVVDGLAARVRRLDPQTGKTLATIAVGGQPSGIALAPDGSLWVTVQAP
jgi:DNA-binding beta-propeller fold protein YncE